MSDAPYRKPASVESNDPPPDPSKPWELQTWTSQRVCPTCSVPLFGARQDGFRIDACGTCGGAWLAHAEAHRMIAARSAIPARLAETAAAAAPNKQNVPQGKPCPDCQAPLERVNHYPCEIDTCRMHGTWFDAHELRAVAEADIRRIQQHESAQADHAIMHLQADGAARGAVVASAGVAFTALRIASGRIPVR